MDNLSSPPSKAAVADARSRTLQRIALALVLIAAVLFVITSLEEDEQGESRVDEGRAPERVDRAELVPPSAPFTDVTEAWGLSFVHENGATGEKLLPETMGSGAAFLDYDGDGDPDLFLVNSDRWPRDAEDGEVRATHALYRNDGDRFVDVTAQSGLGESFYGMGAAVGDFDADGRPDLYVTAVGENHLYRNVDGRRFEDVTASAGVGGGARWSTSAVFLDHDVDGDLDLFVLNYVTWNRELDLEQGFSLVGLGRAYGPPEGFPGESCTLFENRGDGTFEDVSAKAGVVVENEATGVPVAKSLGVVVCRLNDDALPDLVVANDTVRNFAFLNRGDGTFEEVGEELALAHDSSGNARGAMGIAVADHRNAGVTAIAVGNFANEMTALYVNEDRSDILFIDEAPAAGIGAPTRASLTFGVAFFDYDLDGWMDLMAANGHVEPDIGTVQDSQRHAQPVDLFWNAGASRPGYFLPVEPEHAGAALFQPVVGRGLATADIDGDGDLDVLVTVNGGPARLFRNDQKGGRSVRIELVTKNGVHAVGASAQGTSAAGTQVQTLGNAGGYLTASEPLLTFGLGAGDVLKDVVVEWPDGTRQEVGVLRPGRHVIRPSR